MYIYATISREFNNTIREDFFEASTLGSSTPPRYQGRSFPGDVVKRVHSNTNLYRLYRYRRVFGHGEEQANVARDLPARPVPPA
jgi:hypothetical protein